MPDIQPISEPEPPKPKKVAKPKFEQQPAPAPPPKLNIATIDDEADVGAAPVTARRPPPKRAEEKAVVADVLAPDVVLEADVEDPTDASVFIVEGSTEGIGHFTKQTMQESAKKRPVETGNESDRFKVEIERAKELLQQLAKSAQPLDMLIQFSQEDLGNMENEFRRWTSECEKLQRTYETERSETDRQMSDLQSKILDLDKEITRQESKLRSVKSAAFLKESDLMKSFSGMWGR